MSESNEIQLCGRLTDREEVQELQDLRTLIEGGKTFVSGHPYTVHFPVRLGAYALTHQYGGFWTDRCVGAPVLGHRIWGEGRRFADLDGAAIIDGELRLGLALTNFNRQVTFTSDGKPGVADMELDETGFELLFGFLSKVLDGPVGEIVGTIQLQDYDTPGPIVRCADGILRAAPWCGGPPHEWDVGFWHGDKVEEEFTVTVIPVDCLQNPEGWGVDIDADRLRRHLAGIAVAPGQSKSLV